MIMKVRDVLKILRKDGWYKVEQEGSHRHFKHPFKKGKVTVAGKGNDDLRHGVLASIFNQAELPLPGRK